MERVLRERADARLEGALHVDWLGRVVLGPVTIPASRRGRPPVVRVETVRVRPSWLALLRGRARVASLELSGTRVEAGPRGEELARLAERLTGARRGRAPLAPETSLPDLGVRGLTIAWGEARSGPGPLEIGPVDGRIVVRREEGGNRIDAELRLPGGGRGRLRVEPNRGHGASLRASLEAISLQALPAAVAARLPFHAEGGRATARLEADGLATLTAGEARLEIEAGDLVFAGERLAPEPVGPMRLGLRGRIQWDWRARRLALEEAELALGERGEARIAIGAELVLRPEPHFTITAKADRLGYAAALAALPPALAPPADAPNIDGPLSARFALAGPLQRPAGWELIASLDLSGLERAARAVGPPFLAGTFRYRPAASAREIVVGPESPDFVRLAEIPQHVIRAITTSEDAGFFSHQGFDFVELRNAFVEDAEAGRVVRGGSTISQQLAKNLFLSGERTIARKVREALLTVALEASLGKQRLLEIYLNVVEWGPGIHGLGEAARHYFGKPAWALSPREAAFLASVIPNPIRYHVYYDRGALTEAWNQRVNELLLKMREAGQLTDEQFANALAEPLVFARG